MKHEDFRVKLDRYVDGELSADETRRLEEHLASCAECKGELSRLGALLDRATALRERVAIPKRDLWPGILERIAEEAEPDRARRVDPLDQSARSGAGEIRRVEGTLAESTGLPGGRRRSPWTRGRLGFGDLFRGRLPVAWAAAAAAAVVLVWATWPPPPRKAEVSVEGLATVESEAARARSDLDAVLAGRGGQWPDGSGSEFEKNLELLDEAIRDSRAALEADPRNQGLQRSILIVYQKQLDLLRWATRLVQQT